MNKSCENCNITTSYFNNICRACNFKFRNWEPKEKEIKIIKISEEQASDMWEKAHGASQPDGWNNTIKAWKEKGYIIDTNKKCPFCGSDAQKYGDYGKLVCSEDSCWLHCYGLTVEDWNKRA